MSDAWCIMCHHTSAAKQPGRTDWPNLFFHHQMMRVDMDMDPARSRCVNLNVEPLRGRGAQPNQIQMRMEFMLRGACRRRNQTLLLHVLRFYEYFAKYLPYDMSVFGYLDYSLWLRAGNTCRKNAFNIIELSLRLNAALNSVQSYISISFMFVAFAHSNPFATCP